MDKCPAAVNTWAAGLFRMQAAAVCGSAQPAEAATGALVWIARSWLVAGQYMLSMMALLKSPAAGGEIRLAHTSMPPADSPPIVTLSGSPPKAWILALTQRMAACWSINP